MDRRRFLATSVAGIVAGVAGCSTGGTAPDVPEGMTVETRHWVDDVLEDGFWHHRRERDEPPGYYFTTIADREAADDRVDGRTAAVEFFDGTDFRRSYVLVVQNMMQSARWLELMSIERTDGGPLVNVATESPDEPYGDDAAVHSLAIRVTEDRAGVPDEVDVRLEGHPAAGGLSD